MHENPIEKFYSLLTVKVVVLVLPPPVARPEVDELHLEGPEVHDQILVLKLEPISIGYLFLQRCVFSESNNPWDQSDFALIFVL